MKKNLVAELQWRGMIHNLIPGTEKQLNNKITSAYIGFDPTADSLHIGSLVPIILLIHLKKAGHKPYALLGGATGMIGDPSGKSAERNLLDEETLHKNVIGIKSVLSKFLDFDSTEENAPVLLNNYEWMKNFSFIDFVREIGKHLTVNYMMAKDSIKKRLTPSTDTGMSFTEFTYQLIQGYDFYYLYRTHNCLLQMGGSDQWGNITTGAELIRRIVGKNAKAYALTCPLITKADGTKFGKTESGNIWLTKDRTSVYKFYQFWLNISDEDIKKFIKIYTFLTKEEIVSLTKIHDESPHLRILQKRLAEEVTRLVHGQYALEQVKKSTNILFGKSTNATLKSLDNDSFLSIFEGVPQAEVSLSEIENGIEIMDALSVKTHFLKSKGEARRELKQNAISVNKQKVNESFILNSESLINHTFILLQKGKKNYFIIRAIK